MHGPWWLFETEVNGDSKSTNEKGSFLGWFIELVVPVQEIFVACSSRPSTNYFFPHPTLFQFLCPHRLVNWAGSRAGSLISWYVSGLFPPSPCILSHVHGLLSSGGRYARPKKPHMSQQFAQNISDPPPPPPSPPHHTPEWPPSTNSLGLCTWFFVLSTKYTDPHSPPPTPHKQAALHVSAHSSLFFCCFLLLLPSYSLALSTFTQYPLPHFKGAFVFLFWVQNTWIPPPPTPQAALHVITQSSLFFVVSCLCFPLILYTEYFHSVKYTPPPTLKVHHWFFQVNPFEPKQEIV